MGISLHRGPAGESGKGLVYRGLQKIYWRPWRIFKGRQWRRASLSIGTPLGNLERGSVTGDFKRFIGDPGGCVKEGTGDGHLSP